MRAENKNTSGGKGLDVDKMLAELRVEREQIEEAILTLERLARGRGRRRGRPPAWLKEASTAGSDVTGSETPAASAEPRRRGRPPGSKSKQAAAAASAQPSES
jgi:hypothetical protein